MSRKTSSSTQLGAINNPWLSCFCISAQFTNCDPYLITDSIKVLLGRHTKILVKYMVKLELKTDKLENRVLVSIMLLLQDDRLHGIPLCVVVHTVAV